MRRIQLFAAGALALASLPSVAADHVVIARNGPGGRHFDPATLTIDVNDTVTFKNDIDGLGFHNVKSDSDAVTAFRCADGCDATDGNGDLSGAAWSGTVTFPTAGTAGFYCEQHGADGGSGMSGVITIAAAAAPSINVGPATLTAAAEAGAATNAPFTIANAGTATLTWNVDATTTTCAAPETIAWLAFDVASGSVPTGDPADTVNVTLDATALTIGVHNATICIHSNDATNSLVALPVEFTVNTPDLIFSDGFED
jgi:plastocyanin